MAKPNGLILYNDTLEALTILTDAEFRALILAAYRYQNGGEAGELPGGAQYIWPFVRNQVDHSLQSYQHRCEVNAANARKRKAKAAEAVILPSPAAQTDAVFSDADKEHALGCASEEAQTPSPTSEQPLAIASVRCDSVPNINQNQNPNQNQNQNQISNQNRNQDQDQDRNRNQTACASAQSGAERIERAPAAQAEALALASASAESDGFYKEDGIGETAAVIRKPTLSEVRRYCSEYAMLVDADRAYEKLEARGWMQDGKPIASWRYLLDSWQQTAERARSEKTCRLREEAAQSAAPAPEPASDYGEQKASYDIDEFLRAAMRRATPDTCDL